MRLLTASVVAAALGIGLLVLQRWVAETRGAAMILVAAWFVVVAGGVLLASRRHPQLLRPAFATIGVIAVTVAAVGYWTGFRDRTVDEQVVVATRSVGEAERAAALAPAAPAATREPRPAGTPRPQRTPKPKPKPKRSPTPDAALTPEVAVATPEPESTGKPKPAATPTSEPTPEPTPEPKAEAVQLLDGRIAGADGHAASGRAAVVQQADGSRVLTLTDFDADPGPQVDVYLTTTVDDVEDRIDLGSLKGNVGDQQYRIPADADLATYDSLVLWCIPFTTRIATSALR